MTGGCIALLAIAAGLVVALALWAVDFFELPRISFWNRKRYQQKERDDYDD